MKRLTLQRVLGARAVGLPNSCIVPKSTIYATRLGMTNKYKFDYACEDEYFEREMTLMDAKDVMLPLPETWRHKTLPMHEYFPPHWNDVRFNYIPENIDRRMFLHDDLAVYYNMQHDYIHSVGC